MPKFIDLTGRRFGKLVVKEYLGHGDWLCQCDCGNTWRGKGAYLRLGETQSCGCAHYEKHWGPRTDIIGQRFGMWTVIECLGRINSTPKIFYKCRCDCGNEVNVRRDHLLSGASTSCGCERMKHMQEVVTTHKCLPHQLYNSWRAMRERCNNPNNIEYHNYGGRGIAVCNEWNSSYETFRDWAFTHGWKASLTIERVDVNGNYEPSNCTWITRGEQARNTRRNRHTITIDGKTIFLTDACRVFGINYGGVLLRINRKGETPEQALFHRISEVYFNGANEV